VPPFPLAARVVEVIADLGEAANPRYRLGSGCLAAGQTVLTAAHVVTGSISVLVRGPDKVVHRATADPEFIGNTDGRGPDLALVEVVDGVEVPPMALGAVERNSPMGDPIERCHVIGYPAFMERGNADGSRFRETADALGQIPVLSGLAGGLLSVEVSSSPEALPPTQVPLSNSPWSGISGGPVVADGCLLAVVTEHAPRAGPSAITATPLTALEADPEHPGWGPGVTNPAAWWARLGVAKATVLKRLPATSGPSRSAYQATVLEIRQRTGMLIGRQHELDAIQSFSLGDDGYRWLVGEAWAGKTSLLAEAVLTLPEDIDVFCYFLSRREADADSSGFLAAVVPQMAYLLNEDVSTAELAQFRALWHRAIERAGTESRHVILVVDGLDEDLRPPGLPSVAALLPATAGGRAHVLVSSRPHPELPADIAVGHPLRSVRPVLVQTFAGARELEVLARQEIDDLLRRDDDGLAADVFGLMAAAAGPLAVRDLAAMNVDFPPSAALTRRIRGLVSTSAARSLQPVGPVGGDRYQFAHESLLAHAQASDELNDPSFRRRIHQWAEEWQAAGWPTPAGGEEGTPQYLLDNYPSTLTLEHQRLAHLVCDIGWVAAAIASVGADRVLADLHRAVAANPANPAVSTVLTTVTGQAHNLRPPRPLDQPGYVLRQLWMQAAELSEEELADDIRRSLQSLSSVCLVPEWTTRRASRALSSELGRHRGKGWVQTVAVLADEKVVSGGDDARLLVWDLTDPGASPIELGRHDEAVRVVAGLAGERVVSGGADGRILLWDLTDPGASPIELGRHDGTVHAVAGLAGERVVSGGADGRVLLWDLTNPGASPIELGRHDATVRAVAVLPDGRIVTGGSDQEVLVWDPAAPGTRPIELGRHDSIVRAVAVLPDGRVVTGGDRRILVWDPADLGVSSAEPTLHYAVVQAVAVLAGERLVSGDNDGRVLMWDLTDPSSAPVELGRHRGKVRAVAVRTDERLVTGGEDGRVLLWDPTAPGASPVELGRHRGKVRAVAVLADGRVVAGGEDGRVLIWDAADPDADPVELGHNQKLVRAMAVLADGRVVTGGRGGVLVWDPVRPDADPVDLGLHDEAVQSLAVLPDGRVVAGGNQKVLIVDPATPAAATTALGRHNGAVRSVAVLDGGRVVTGGTDQRVLVWNPLEPGTQVAQLNCSVTTLATTSLGSKLIIAHVRDDFSLWSFTTQSKCVKD
jgi:WD40 repeat protein